MPAHSDRMRRVLGQVQDSNLGRNTSTDLQNSRPILADLRKHQDVLGLTRM
jgi:hypothetical protein